VYNEVVLITTDIIVDLQYGDCAKGKVAHYLCKDRSYTHILRYNGGCNAGHTIYHNGMKFVTHHIPAGVFYGITSIIGPGCVLDPVQFFKELGELKDGGLDIEGKIFIAKNTHIITTEHRQEDSGDTKIGTTKRGNGQAYRDKYARVGVRAESIPELQPYLIDLYDEFHTKGDVHVLCEGAQGFGLDIDWGDYPYVTSSSCIVPSALANGLPYKSVNEVWGVAKMYETYVGSKKFEPDDDIFKQIRDVGEEYGATTKRPRQCNWLNLNLLEKAVRINGVTHVVFSKVDVLREVGVWKVLDSSGQRVFDSEEEMKTFITDFLVTLGLAKANIFFSEKKEGI
jgi:adenylosuccinate synthase